MGHTYTNLSYHLVFSTKDRLPLISKVAQPRLYAYIGGIIRELKGETLAIGGVEDHVHILCRLGTAVSMADALRQIKGSSSKWANDELKLDTKFAWQTGYAAFTVSQSKIGNVEKYIAEQQDHHRQRGFKDELLDFLQKHGIEYDERYLWD
ncbi:MAG: IS200/IS605 family transposase [Planctomycetes bacterium]|nr:IS200/IS605 family transposase [Planctomycetota bacterium]